MDDTIYTITLSDGTVLDNLKLNGNNFISQKEVLESDFEGKLSKVVISSDEMEETLYNAELIQVTKEDDGWWFILREVPEDERRRRQIESNIEYIAMMADIDLEV